MAKTAFKGAEVNTSGDLPKIGEEAPDFLLVSPELKEVSLAHYHGQKVILNIYPSVDTGICAMSTVKFNQEAAKLENTRIVCVSKDLPFAFQRYCAAEGIENLDTLSFFRNADFAKSYGVELIEGPLKGLSARAVVILDENGKVIYTELVPDITQEPDYSAALSAL